MPNLVRSSFALTDLDRRKVATAIGAVIVVLASGCATSEPATKGEAPSPTASTASPVVQERLATDDPTNFAGVITDTMNAGGYTYLLVRRDDSKNVWIAVGEQKMAPGDRVKVRRNVMMHDFHSKTLERTFARIVFGDIVELMPGTGAPATGSMKAGEETSPATDDREVHEL